MTKSFSFIDDYYSLDDLNRSEAIQLLANDKSVDAARELIQIYNSCEWRDTKFQILSSLAEFNDSRSIQFLIKTTLDQKDIPLSESAVLSLSKMNSPISRHFLSNCYKNGPQFLKSTLCQIFSKQLNNSLCADFRIDLKKSIAADQFHLAKNLILALGELKDQQATKSLIEIAQNKNQRELAVCAIISLGKILRDPDLLLQLGHYIVQNDPIEQEIFSNALTQIQFRSQWTLEDYLEKFFTNKHVHPGILLEIITFPASEIQEKLQKYPFLEFQNRYLQLYKKMPAEVIQKWVSQLSADDSEIIQNEIFGVIAEQPSSLHSDFLFKHQDLKQIEWLRSVAFGLPEADKIILHLYKAKHYHDLDPKGKIQFINVLSEYLTSSVVDLKVMKNLTSIIETEIETETEPSIQSRWIRLAAEIGFTSPVLQKLFLKLNQQENLQGSLLYYLEHGPKNQNLELFIEIHKKLEPDSGYLKTWIQSLKNLNPAQASKSEVQKILEPLRTHQNAEVHFSLLKFLSLASIESFHSYVIESLKSKDQRILTQAIIACKKIPPTSILADALAPFLKYPLLPIQGRAYDTLLSYNELRAQRICIDYFVDQIHDSNISGKFLRSFQLPATSSDYFIKKIESILKNKPDFKFYDEISQLLQNLKLKNSDNTQNKKIQTIDTIKIDQFLEKEISSYKCYDESVKIAIRAAEIPFQHPEMFDQSIDKSVIILSYSKAIDLVLEKQFGKKFLFPQLENRLFEFQNVTHVLGLNESYPPVDKVIQKLGLEKHFSTGSFPLHKLTLISQGILNAKIINDQFKILDGLRSWAILFLVFCRKHPQQNKAVIPLSTDENSLISVSKKLLWLQDIRNPVAHRQIVIDFSILEETRKEVFVILNQLDFLFKS